MKKNSEDYPVTVQSGLLRKARKRLERITHPRPPIPELLLTVASVSLGGVLGAWQGGMTATTNHWWIFFILLPVIAGASVVAFWFLRRDIVHLARNAARDVLEDLPDPDSPETSQGPERMLLGKWRMSSTTDQSGKQASADVLVSNRLGRMVISGVMKGESESKIGEITSQLCDFDPDARKVMSVYRVFGIDDDGKIGVTECVLSGIVHHEDEGGKQPVIIGHWFQLYGALARGRVTLTKVG